MIDLAQRLHSCDAARLPMAPPELAPDGRPFVLACGVYWQVRRWIKGIARADGDAAMVGLAELHRALKPATDPGDPPEADSFHRRLEALDSVARFAAEPDTPVVVEAARAALRRAVPPAGAPLLHGDARPEYAIMADGACVGWSDDATRGGDSPWRDVARLAGELAAGDQAVRDRLVGVYARHANATPPRGLVEALELSGLVVAVLRWRRWIAQPTGDGLAPGAPERLAALESRLERIMEGRR
mgnify:CR=1 FL=1